MEGDKINLDSVPPFVRPYLEAKENGTLVKYFLDRFRHFRNDYTDEAPGFDVRIGKVEGGKFVDDNYKGWGNYMGAVGSLFNTAIEDGAINDPQVIEQIQNFNNRDFAHLHGELSSPEEIAAVNSVLDLVIKYLEKEVPSK